MATEFQRLMLQGWRQFSEVDIRFHERLTVITGSNGVGKSTILKILAQHFGWQNPLLSTPVYQDGGVLTYAAGFDLEAKSFKEIQNFRLPQGPQMNVGRLAYTNGVSTELLVPVQGSASYNLQVLNQQHIPGIYVGSHRPINPYQQVGQIPITPINAQTAYQSFDQETKNRAQGGHSPHGLVYRMKETLISMAMFGVGNEYVPRNSASARMFEGFKRVLAEILPSNIGFRDISIRVPDVVIVTETGDFMIDAASGGLMALIELAWQIFLFAQGNDNFVVVMDEPENHLHPSMQRSLLGRLLKAFPRTQFVIATHSPFMVSSIRDSKVYVLKNVRMHGHQEHSIMNKVFSEELDHVNRAGTASEILRDALGVPVTLPEWAESELRSITSEFENSPLDAAGVERLGTRLDQEGLGEYYPDALRELTKRK